MSATQRENSAARGGGASRGRGQGGESRGRAGATFSLNFLKMEEGGVWPWRIPLVKKKKVVGYAKVSPEDAVAVSELSWYICQFGYCKTSQRKSSNQNSMHRYIMIILQNQPATRDMYVDHINGDRLDNRRENLRFANAKQNGQNKLKQKTPTTSKFLGVHFCKTQQKFISRVTIDNVVLNLGVFDSEVDAAKARDCYILHQTSDIRHGLNFPELKDELKQQQPVIVERKADKKFRHVTNKGSSFHACVASNKVKLLDMHNKDKIFCAKAVDACIVKHGLKRKLNFPEDYPNYTPTLPIKTLCEEVNATQVRLILKSAPAAIVLIDKSDYDLVKHYNLYIQDYVIITVNGKNHKLHRFLLQVEDITDIIDHIDNNKLNNCRSNLRRVTSQQNSQNRKKSKNSFSAFYGVRKRDGRFMSFVQSANLNYTKVFNIESHAARDRDLVILKLFPDSAYKMNFVWTPEDIDEWSFFLLNKYYV